MLRSDIASMEQGRMLCWYDATPYSPLGKAVTHAGGILAPASRSNAEADDDDILLY